MTATAAASIDVPRHEVQNIIISVDDHLIEPPDAFTDRMPLAMADAAPRVVELDDGTQAWLMGGRPYPNIGLSAVAGRPPGEWNHDPSRFEQMRPGCYEIHERIHDMDINGVWASICFPSSIAGFAGARFYELKDRLLGQACVRAWNDWHHDVWSAPYPDRIIPLQVTHLDDPALAAEEVFRNAERGFKALSFPDIPEFLGCESVRSGAWDPVLGACAETGTTLCLHVGSAGKLVSEWVMPGERTEITNVLFSAGALIAATSWLFSGAPMRFSKLQIALSEGGIGWVPMLLDRLDFMLDHGGRAYSGWQSKDLTPAEVLQRNFYFCTIDDPSTIGLHERIGTDRIMLESDYPHGDSTWPDTQMVAGNLLSGLSKPVADAISHGNAARLFRHPLPPPPVAKKP